jgi:cell wall-associated NlpC family hydrolase
MHKLLKTSAVGAASLAMGATMAIAATGTAAAAPSSDVARVAAGSQPTLKVGQRSEDVKRLQRALTADGYDVPATGYYGSMTRAAVTKYQRAHDVPATGVTAKLTWGSLQGHGESHKTTSAAPAQQAAPAAEQASGSRAEAVAFARAQLGKPYAWGGTGPGAYDCSGLTQAALKAAGKNIPRTSQAQLSGGKQISLSQAQPGDLVVYYSGASHIGIYIGDGQIIHSSRPGKPVSVAPVSSMPINAVVSYF